MMDGLWDGLNEGMQYYGILEGNFSLEHTKLTPSQTQSTACKQAFILTLFVMI